MKKTRLLNVPNALSGYRIVALPFIIAAIYRANQDLFILLLSINLVTDILDGFIARRFNMMTEFGARLDSWADTGTFICAFFAIYLFKWSVLKPHWPMLLIFFGVWLLSYAVVLMKFRGLIGLHTYLFKITGYLQGVFIVVLFILGFYPWLFYISLSVGTIACIEEMVIIALLRQPMMNVKGLYWILKEKKLAV
jgi:cardiolipin synthase